MSERRPWSKFWDAEYLADAEMNSLTLRQRALVHILWPLCRTQTDEPGVFIRKGSVMTPEAIAALVRPHADPGPGGNRRHLTAWVVDALLAGPFMQREDGAWFSPRIVREAAESEKQATYGRIGREKQLRALHYSADDTARQTPGATPGPTPGLDQRRADTDTEQSRAEGDTPRGGEPAPEALVLIWNEECRPPLKRSAMSAGRREKATKLLAENSDLGYWRTVIQRINASPYCRGETGKDFIANFDFVLDPETHVKVMEGNYDANARAPAKGGSDMSRKNAEALSRFARGGKEVVVT